MQKSKLLNELVEGCVRGERRSQQLIYTTFAGKMKTVCLRYLKSREDALSLVFDPNEAFSIDYKTGTEKQSHISQIETYQNILEEMNYKVLKKILIYINDDIQIKEF